MRFLPLRWMAVLAAWLVALATAADDAPVRLPEYRVVEDPLAVLGVRARIGVHFFSRKVTSLTVRNVEPRSIGAKACLRVGDEIVALRGQPVVGRSRAEVVELGTIPAGGELRLTVRAGGAGEPREVVLRLPPPTVPAPR